MFHLWALRSVKLAYYGDRRSRVKLKIPTAYRDWQNTVLGLASQAKRFVTIRITRKIRPEIKIRDRLCVSRILNYTLYET